MSTTPAHVTTAYHTQRHCCRPPRSVELTSAGPPQIAKAGSIGQQGQDLHNQCSMKHSYNVFSEVLQQEEQDELQPSSQICSDILPDTPRQFSQFPAHQA